MVEEGLAERSVGDGGAEEDHPRQSLGGDEAILTTTNSILCKS